MSERLIAAAKANYDTSPIPGDFLIPPRLLVREAVASLGWGTMTYACDTCGFEWSVWLSLGVEGPPALRDAGLYLASPMWAGACPAWPIKPDATPEERAQLRHMAKCDGRMGHVRFREDREFAAKLIPDDAPRFIVGPYDSAHLVIPEDALVAARRFHADRESRP